MKSRPTLRLYLKEFTHYFGLDFSGSRETPVWCMIYDDLEYNHEADIFANQMKYVKSLLPFEIFQANIEAGNNKQLLIKELVRV